ncbi:hypothetical protein L3Q82_006751 [Scortum barcoo]|uniref:Uncharacterized protein n=1 Tax=Scortum barcoo TaxID=214431 RepID=A0ACB8WW41_9TELE|nr:hypothetical protein L3Q82_006751 [Scortum barcoo]
MSSPCGGVETRLLPRRVCVQARTPGNVIGDEAETAHTELHLPFTNVYTLARQLATATCREDMKLLFLACLSPQTGNHTTAERIRSHIESAGHTCELRDAAEFQSSAEVADLASRNPPFEGALAIHLFRAGRLLLDTQVPFGVIFGGTDINEDVKVEQKRAVMEQVLQKARGGVEQDGGATNGSLSGNTFIKLKITNQKA